jgi:hypothetical protein
MAKPMSLLQKKRHLETQVRKLRAIQEQVRKAILGESFDRPLLAMECASSEIGYAMEDLNTAIEVLTEKMKESKQYCPKTNTVPT